MTVALPTQFVDAVSSATSTGMELAGNRLQSVAHAAESASEATSTRAGRIVRASRRNLPHRSNPARSWVLVVPAVAAAMAVAFVIRRVVIRRGVIRRGGSRSATSLQ